MTPDTTKTSQSTIPVPFPLGNTVFTPYSPHIHSKTTNSALHDMHRPRTGPQERSTAAHTRRSNYIDRPADPGPREPTFVAVPPGLAHTARAGHAGPRAAATWTAADGGLTSSAATTAPAAAAAVPLVAMASDATAARHSLRVVGVRKSARRRCTCWGTQAMQASTTEAYAWRRYLQRAAFLVVRAGPPSPAVRPGPIHGMDRALYAVRHTPSRDCRAGTAQKQREMPMAEPATRAHCSKIMPRRAQTLPASWGRLPAIVCAPGPTLSWAVQLGRLSWRVDSGAALKTHLGAVEGATPGPGLMRMMLSKGVWST